MCLVTYAANGLSLGCPLLGKLLDSGLDLQALERAFKCATCGDLRSSIFRCHHHKLAMQRACEGMTDRAGKMQVAFELAASAL